MTFHILRQQGLSIRKIAALQGVSRNAVRRALRSSSPPTGKRRREKGCKLKAYEALVHGWLKEPVKSQWTAQRIFEELQARDYPGGCTVVRDFVALHRQRPVAVAEARFYVKPGQQLQVDWAEMGLTRVGGIERKLYAFIGVLSWSRAMFICFTTDMTVLTWLDCHLQAFRFFGGVAEEVLIDNLKTGVDSRAGGTVRWHPKYEEFAVGMGFRPIAHFPRRPKTKGRVERMVRFLRQAFFDGREISTLEELNLGAIEWLVERANRRVHRVTRERPCDRFTIEQAALHPVREYDIVLEETRVSDPYALVAIEGVRYSIPSSYPRRNVTVQFRPSGLRFIVDGAIVAAHDYAKPGQRLVQDPMHLPPPPRPKHQAFTDLADAVAERFGEIGRSYADAIERAAPHAPLALLREVLERAGEYGDPLVSAALETLLSFTILKRGMLSRLCERFGAVPVVDATNLVALPDIDVEHRSLSAYDEVAA
ncbi:MAG: IS21 family transposase [Vulcanimicrobiaceae bacterium]